MTTATPIPTYEARGNFAALVEEAAAGRRYVVTHYGRERCALVSVEDLRRLEEIERRSKPAPKRRRS